MLQVSDDVDPDGREGTELTHLHGVAVRRETPVPDALDAIEVPAGMWAVFRTSGPFPQTLQTAWAAYTSGSAWINRRDEIDGAGELAPGAAADLAVLDRDPFAGPAEEIGATKVVSTWIDGEVVHSIGG